MSEKISLDSSALLYEFGKNTLDKKQRYVLVILLSYSRY